MIMGSTWIDETGVYLFLWQTLGMTHCKYDGGCLIDLDVTHQELEIDEMISSYERDTHMDDVGIGANFI